MAYLKAIAASLVLMWVAVTPSSASDNYPSKLIKLVIPFPPGGTTDIVGRMLGQKLSEVLGKPVVVENKSGAGGLVGTDFVAKSAPDGYTILLSNSGALATALKLVPSMQYDVIRDFAPISMISDVDIVLAVNPQVPAKTVVELVDHIRKNPAKLNAGIPSVGSMHHLITESFKRTAQLDIVSIPYKGSTPAIMDLIGGQVQLDFDNLPALSSYIASGQVRALAVASAERSAYLPDLPTMRESGYPEIVANPWFALMAPVGTPRPVVERLNREVVKIMQSDEMKKRLRAQGANARWSTPEECAAFIQSEIDRWGKIVEKAQLKIE